MAAQNYEIREALEDEQSVLVTFLEKYYFCREYVTQLYLNKNKYRTDEIERQKIKNDIRKSYAIIVANVPSLVAINKESKEIVGSILLMVEENPCFSEITRSDQNLDVQICPIKAMPHPFESKLLRELATRVVTVAHDSADLFAKFPLQRTALRLLFLCVNPEHCERGLATKFIQEAVNFAETKGIGFVYAICMSPLSRKATEKHGFKSFSDMDILSCRDNDGNAMFEGEESHIISVMAKQVQSV